MILRGKKTARITTHTIDLVELELHRLAAEDGRSISAYTEQALIKHILEIRGPSFFEQDDSASQSVTQA